MPCHYFCVSIVRKQQPSRSCPLRRQRKCGDELGTVVSSGMCFVFHLLCFSSIILICIQCYDCKEFIWHTPSTPLNNIPTDVQISFAMRQSASVAAEGSASAVLCAGNNCLTSTNQRRRANKECDRSLPHCSACCKGLGGCRVHRLSQRDIPLAVTQPSAPIGPNVPDSTPSVAAASAVPPPAPVQVQPSGTRALARPLDLSYGLAYLEAHRKSREAQEKIEAEQRLASSISNTVLIVLWNKVCLVNVIFDYDYSDSRRFLLGRDTSYSYQYRQQTCRKVHPF